MADSHLMLLAVKITLEIRRNDDPESGARTWRAKTRPHHPEHPGTL
jgi:hypothetical protein